MPNPDRDPGMRALGRQRILFCHQSVGAGILQGIAELRSESADTPLVPDVRSAVAEDSAAPPALYETRVGRNGDARSKIDGCATWMESPFGRVIDIAIFKLCYVDITERTDVEDLFAYYQRAAECLARTRPRIAFIHVTVPLEGDPSGPLASVRRAVKTVLGRTDAPRNLARERFNQLLRTAYGPQGRLFDLARIESTDPRGRRVADTYQGLDVPRLASQYTDDGGHLNQLGRRVVAEAFLTFLAKVPPRE